jgi:hypothetical protein
MGRRDSNTPLCVISIESTIGGVFDAGSRVEAFSVLPSPEVRDLESLPRTTRRGEAG